MSNPKNSDELKARIRELETQTLEMEEALRMRLEATYDSLRPVNLLKSTIRGITSDADLKNGILSSLVQFGLDFLGGSLLWNRTGSITKKAIGAALRLGATGKGAGKSFRIWKKFLSNLFTKDSKAA